MSKAWTGKKVLILGLGQYPKGSGISAALFAARIAAAGARRDEGMEDDIPRDHFEETYSERLSYLDTLGKDKDNEN